MKKKSKKFAGGGGLSAMAPGDQDVYPNAQPQLDLRNEGLPDNPRNYPATDRAADIENSRVEPMYPVETAASLYAGIPAAIRSVVGPAAGLVMNTENIKRLYPDIAPGKVPPTRTRFEETFGYRSPRTISATNASKALRNRNGADTAAQLEMTPAEYYRNVKTARDASHGFIPGSTTTTPNSLYKRGGKVKSKAKVKKLAKGGSVSSASKRADGCAERGKTKGRYL